MKRRIFFALFIIILTCSTQAALVSFERITDNAAVDISSQLKLNVYYFGKEYDATYGEVVDKIKMIISNEDSANGSTISEIYFYDTTVISSLAVTGSSPGVVYDNSNWGQADPSHLPGYNPQNNSLLTSIEPDNPSPHNGIQAGEHLEIVSSLKPGCDLDCFLDQLSSGEVVIGVHVQTINNSEDDDESDSFVTVPEPGTMSLLGLGCLVFTRRRKKS